MGLRVVFSTLVLLQTAKNVDESSNQVILGSEDGDHLSMMVMGRAYPGRNDYWDGNWLFTRIEISAQPFEGVIDGLIRSDEFDSFRKELADLNARRMRTATLISMENWVRIELKGEERGRIEARCQASDKRSGRTFSWTFELDQSYLPLILRSLTRIVEAFPVVGAAGAGGSPAEV